MKNPKSTKKVFSRRSFIKSLAAGGGAVYLLGKVGNSLAAQDLEVFSEPKSAKGTNEPSGTCNCGMGLECAGSGGRGSCQCGMGLGCGGGGF